MGGNQSSPEEDGQEYTASEMTERMQEVLDENTYTPGDDAKYPYFLVQLNEEGELPFGDDQILVSDCIAAHVAQNSYTHIIAQTHGWSTPPEKAVAVPFAEFMTGMQNDAAMPTENFNPIFVAFIWPAVPQDFIKEEDALTRTELLIKSESENAAKDSDILEAAEAAKVALENEDPEDADLQSKMATLAEHTVDVDAAEAAEEEDEDARAIQEGDPDAVVQRARNTRAGRIIEGVLSTFTPVLRPLENLMFGRLMKRGRQCGTYMGLVIGKMMKVAEGRPRVCMMANSLGAHMLVGVLSVADQFPYKLHTVFFVQGAISKYHFAPGRRYANLRNRVAGPFVATYSDHDYMLCNVFGPFHGDALGFEGFSDGEVIDMKSMEEITDSPYDFSTDCCCSINGSQFIDEGNAIAGGHGDFKEDETTSLYWSMITTELDDSAYDW